MIPAETARLFCIGRQVVYRPPGEDPQDQPVSVHLVRAKPVSFGGRVMVPITGLKQPVPIEHLRIDTQEDPTR